MGEFRLKIGDLAIATLFGSLVLLFLSQSATFAVDETSATGRVPYLFLNFEGLDVGEPPIAFLIFDKIGHKFGKLDASLKPHIVNDFFEVGECLAEMSTGGRLGDGILITISCALCIGN
jgi:hypothetical protein